MYHCHLLTEVASRQNLLVELNDRMKTLILRGHAFPCHLRVAEIDGLSKGKRDKIAVYIFMFHCCSLTLCSKCMSEVQGMCEATISSKTCIIDVPFSLTFLCDCNRQRVLVKKLKLNGRIRYQYWHAIVTYIMQSS